MTSYASLDALIERGQIQLGRGKVISKKDIAADPGTYPIYSSARENNGKFGEYGQYMFDEELITWSVDGGGDFFYRPPHKFSVTNVGGFLRILDRSRIDYRYLHYALAFQHSQLTFDWITKAHPSVIRRLYTKIPLPTIQEQHRIVGLLSRAENILQMRREAEQRAKEIIPALFLDMFGDPATNPKGWGIEPLAEVAAIESPLRTPNFVTEATEVCIGPDSIESMTGQLLSQPTVGDIRPISGKYRYRCRDVLYSKIRPALVKVALAPSDGYCSADMYPLRCGPKLQPEYLMQILLNRHFTRYALDRATRAQMPKINREALFAFRLPVPPIDLQESFARHCQGYMGVREQQRTAMGTAELAFQSLLARVFGE